MIEPVPNLPEPPFPGFSPFEETESIYFFGRERERRIILANLLTRRLTVLYGPSGVGKSSVINAGVVPDLRHSAASLQIARQMEVPILGSPTARSVGILTTGGAPEPLVITFNRWVDDPLESLHLKIVESVADRFGVELANTISKQPLTETLESIVRSAPGTDILIILDQFEEYFVYHANDTVIGGFGDEFSRAVVNLDRGVNFLISIREDWLSKLDRFKGEIPNLFGNSIRIEHLARTAAEDAIRKPVEKYNEQLHGKRPKVEVTDEFVKAVLDQLHELDNKPDQPDELDKKSGDQTGNISRDGPIQGPHLQIVMEYFWKQITNSSTPRLDGQMLANPNKVRTIINSYLQQYLELLSSSEKRLAANILPFLVGESGTKLATTAKGLSDRGGRRRESIQALLEKLANSKLLTRIGPPPGEDALRYQLTTDVLANPIIDWTREIRAIRKRRNTGWKFLGITFLVLLIGMLVVAGLQLRRERDRRKTISDAKEKTEAERARAEQALQLVRAQDDRIPYSKAVLRGHSMIVTSAVFTPEGKVLTASADGKAILWNLETRESKTFPGDDPLIFAKAAPEGNRVVTANTKGELLVWNSSDMQNFSLRGSVPNHITDISFSPDGKLIVAASTKGEIFVWDVGTGTQVKSASATGQAILQVQFSPSGKYLAFASKDNTVRLWRGSDLSELTVLSGHTGSVNGLAFSPNEELLVTASQDTTVRIWNLSDFNAHVLKGHEESVNSVDFDPQGLHLLTTSDDTTARIWNIATRSSRELIGHNDKVLSGSFSPDGARAATASKDTVVRIWSAGTGDSLFELKGHFEDVTYVTYSEDGRYILTASNDATARVWSVPDPRSFEIAQPTISSLQPQYSGRCPTTISFIATITALKGSGPVVYRFKGSDQRTSPYRTINFDKPGVKSVGAYWRVMSDFSGYQTLEIAEPPGHREEKVSFSVKCTAGESSPAPEASPASSPVASPGP